MVVHRQQLVEFLEKLEVTVEISGEILERISETTPVHFFRNFIISEGIAEGFTKKKSPEKSREISEGIFERIFERTPGGIYAQIHGLFCGKKKKFQK